MMYNWTGEDNNNVIGIRSASEQASTVVMPMAKIIAYKYWGKKGKLVET